MPSGLRELHPFGEPDALGMIGESASAWTLREELARVAWTDDNVLIFGESGTGKELAANALHRLSKRATGPWVACNASTFTLSLLDSQLFGNLANYPNHGMQARKGLFGTANLGTLFFDEIGDLFLEAQSHLLRVLDSGEYQPLGEATARRVEVRAIGATNRDESLLRADLLARFLARIRIPPLRERQEDIPLLLRAWLLQRATKFPELKRFIRPGPSGRPEPQVSGRLVDYLVRQPLPSNVRELHGLVLKAVNASSGDVVRMPFSDHASLLPPPAFCAEEIRVEEPGKMHSDVRPSLPSKEELIAWLKPAGGNVARVVKEKGIKRTTLYRLMGDFGLKIESFRGGNATEMNG